MKQFLSIALLTFLLGSCSNGKTQSSLSAKEFAAKLKSLPEAVILDVRTPAEFSNGHLNKALNFDWNSSQFEEQIKTLDKSKPVFVYCLSGGRSSEAAEKMRSDGFREIYEMNGGLMQWRNEHLPETTNNQTVSTGMTKQAFEALLDPDRVILIDFYAEWCAPCKKMEPYLDEISTELKNSVTVIRINVDENKTLCDQLGISAIPVLQVYKDKKITWTNTGFIGKQKVLKHLI